MLMRICHRSNPSEEENDHFYTAALAGVEALLGRTIIAPRPVLTPIQIQILNWSLQSSEERIHLDGNIIETLQQHGFPECWYVRDQAHIHGACDALLISLLYHIHVVIFYDGPNGGCADVLDTSNCLSVICESLSLEPYPLAKETLYLYKYTRHGRRRSAPLSQNDTFSLLTEKEALKYRFRHFGY